MQHKIQTFDTKVLDITDITPTVKHFKFSVPDGFDFTAGQFVTALIELEDGNKIKRSYSIASAPRKENFLELCIKRVEGGPGTGWFWHLKKGDTAKFMGPLGMFKVSDEAMKSNLCYISTGTGYAPFRSMIFNLLENGFKGKIFHVVGYRYEDEELYPEEVKALQEKYDNFEYHCIISRPRAEDYSGDKGHVQELIGKYVPEDFEGHYYMCGLSAMIEDTQKYLKERGVAEENIHFEKYD